MKYTDLRDFIACYHPENRHQRAATEQLLTSRNRITALQGYAGTAKTTTVLATFAREAEARRTTRPSRLLRLRLST